VAVQGQGLLIFDGDCGFCTSSAEWVSHGWPPGPTAVAWQHLTPEQLRQLKLSLGDVQDAAWWVDEHGRRFRGDRAIAKSLLACTGGRRIVGSLMSAPPLSWASAAVYPLVVRYRHRLPGATPACRVHPPGERASTSPE
jgi:predicted DCC family thiol-disulfide oxidoreductase YuxK